jgi:DNA-binding GntR family transcriptional regulator
MPPYVRVLTGVLAAIDAGELRPGDRLPSMAELAAQYEVSVTTVKRALSLLKDRGVVVGVPGLGTYVAED